MNFFFSLVVLFIKLLLFNCKSEVVDQSKLFLEPDLKIDFHENGEIIQLVAFKSPENDLILKEKSVQNYERLRWYSIGKPLLIKIKSNSSEYLFQFNRRGFYARIEMLTNSHKQLLISEVKRVHNITVGLSQVDHLILSSFNCEIPIQNGHNANETTVIKVD